MKYKRCTRCELNYCTEEEEYCKICVKELKGDIDYEDGEEPDGDICPFCEENVLPYGEEMCKECAALHNAKDDDSAVPVKTKINFIEIE